MRGREAALTAGVGVAAFVVQLPLFDRWFGLLDEGYLLALSEEVLRGKVLYRDVYVDNPLPGAFYVVAGWFRLVGASVWSSRVLAVCLFTLFTILVFRIGRALMDGRWTVLLVLALLCFRVWGFPHWQAVGYASLSATFLAAALLAAFHCLDQRRPALLVTTGVLVGAAIVCKQDYGLGVGGTLGLVWLLRPVLARSSTGAVVPAALYSAGVTLVVVPVLLGFAAAGALGALVEQTLLRPLYMESTSNYPRLPPILPLLSQTPGLRADAGSYFPAILVSLPEWWNALYSGWAYRETALWDVAIKLAFYTPFVTAAVAAVAWLRRRPVPERRLLVLAYVCGFLLAFNRPRDWAHLTMMYPPTLLVGLTLVAGAPPRLARAAWVALGVGLVGLALVSLRLGADFRRYYAWPLAGPRAGVAVDAENGPLLDDVLGYIERRAVPGSRVPVFPLQPGIAFLSGREGAAGFHVIWPGQDPARDERIIADLEAHDVQLVIYSFSQYAMLGSFRANAPLLYDYLVDHFIIERVFAREPFGSLLCGLGRRVPDGSKERSLLPLVPSAGPPGVLTVARWPFAEVMAQTVGTPHAPAVARLAVDVPAEGQRLVFGYGMNPDRWLGVSGEPLTFTLAVEDEAEPPVELMRATIDPQRKLEDRQWRPSNLDLGRWAGRRVRLAFAVESETQPNDPAGLAGWAEPRLVDH